MTLVSSSILVILLDDYSASITQNFRDFLPGKIVEICDRGTSTLRAVQSSCTSMDSAFSSFEIEFSIFITLIIVLVGGTVRAILILKVGNAKTVDFGPSAGWVFIIVQNNWNFQNILSDFTTGILIFEKSMNIVLYIGKSYNRFVRWVYWPKSSFYHPAENFICICL